MFHFYVFDLACNTSMAPTHFHGKLSVQIGIVNSSCFASNVVTHCNHTSQFISVVDLRCLTSSLILLIIRASVHLYFDKTMAISSNDTNCSGNNFF